MLPFFDQLWTLVLSSDSRFASGVAFSILLLFYTISRIYIVLSRFIRDLLDLFIVKKRQMDQIIVEKERQELDLQKFALDNLKRTNEFNTLSVSKDSEDEN